MWYVLVCRLYLLVAGAVLRTLLSRGLVAHVFKESVGGPVAWGIGDAKVRQ